MLGQTKLKSISHQLLHLAKSADQAEVLISASDHALTRFANNQIHQNVASEGVGVQLRVILSKKIGVASTDRLDQAGLESLAGRALTLAKHQKEDPGFVSLPSPLVKPYPKVSSFSSRTAAQTPRNRAKSVATIIKIAQGNHLTSSGAYEIKLGEIAVANSLGVWAYGQESKAELSTTFDGQQGSGWGEAQSRDVSEVDPEQVARTAIHRATFGGKLQSLSPGEYEVIFEPEATFPFSSSDEFFGYYGHYAANARIYHEDVSILQEKLNQPLFSPQLTVIDNPLDPDCLPMPFDFEGVPKTRMTFINRGKPIGIAYDSYYAHKYHQPNTGHALPAPNVWGPIPGHLEVQPGTSTREQMIKNIKTGLLVSQLHYLRILHYRDLSLTGMTRNGLFIIKNGELIGRTQNLRFTDSIPSIFSKIQTIGGETKKVRSLWGGIVKAPLIHFSSFNFTSATQFG